MDRARKGTVLIEFTLVVPLFLLLCVAGIDLARVFNTAIVLTGATRTGLEYAGQSATAAADTVGIANLVSASAGNPAGLSVTSIQFCTCSIGGTQIDCSSKCSGKITYVQVSASLPFQTLIAWPYFPQRLMVTKTGVIRVTVPPPGGGGFG
jgi:Flp pilus assembly protein TadG